VFSEDKARSELPKDTEAVIESIRLVSDHDVNLQPVERSTSRDLDVDFKEASENIDSGTQLRVLDEQILRFQKDNEALARLRKQAELAEAELVRERDILRSEVEAERRALQAEADREREELRRERLNFEREAEAKRKEAAKERLELRERLDELRKELSGKERHWQRSVERLQRQVTELSQKNRELLESRAKTASYVARAAQTIDTFEGDCHSEASSFEPAVASSQEVLDRSPFELGRNQEALPELTEVPPLPELALPVSMSSLSVEPEAEQEVSTSDAPSAMHNFHDNERSLRSMLGKTPAPAGTQGSNIGARRPRASVAGAMPKTFVASRCESSASSLAKPGIVIREERGGDGRSERFFEDGRREVLFLSGLRKVQWPDGRVCVFFQNGDVKESIADGTVIYRYHSTGAVQTTHADGTDIFRFAGGQVECHRPDGSKEIEFANGARKRISADGFEEVSPANSGGVWTPLEDAMNFWAAGAGA
jgi:centromere protein J